MIWLILQETICHAADALAEAGALMYAGCTHPVHSILNGKYSEICYQEISCFDTIYLPQERLDKIEQIFISWIFFQEAIIRIHEKRPFLLAWNWQN